MTAVEIVEGLRIRQRAFSDARAGETADLIEQLHAALKPFAEAANDISDHVPDRWSIWEQPAAMEITIGDLRRASAVISPTLKGTAS